MGDVFKVIQETRDRTRTLFSGPEKAARLFIANNFPRAHVEPPNQDPGIPDVKLVGPNGNEDTYHAEDGWASEKPAEAASADTEPARSDLV